MREGTYKLGGGRDCWRVIDELQICQALEVESDPQRAGGLLFLTADGDLVGRLTAKSPVAIAVEDGMEIVSCEVNSFNTSDQTDTPSARVRIMLADPDEALSIAAGRQALAALTEGAPRTYTVGIVGESNYQEEISKCAPGMVAWVRHEVGNPHDDRALVVLSQWGGRIGYIGRDSWLHDAVHEEGKGCVATIASIQSATTGKLGVVLSVRTCAGGVEQERFARAELAEAPERLLVEAPAAPERLAEAAPAGQPQGGWFRRLFGR